MSENTVNEQGNNGGSVTEGLPTRYEVINCNGVVSQQKFATAKARYAFPDQEQDEDRTGKGWDIAVVGS